jgi:hypothetical protein
LVAHYTHERIKKVGFAFIRHYFGLQSVYRTDKISKSETDTLPQLIVQV